MVTILVQAGGTDRMLGKGMAELTVLCQIAGILQGARQILCGNPIMLE
jgi:hypothetical protein